MSDPHCKECRRRIAFWRGVFSVVLWGHIPKPGSAEWSLGVLWVYLLATGVTAASIGILLKVLEAKP